MKKTQKWQDSQQTLLHHSFLHIMQGFDPKPQSLSYINLPASENPLLPVGGMPHCWHQDSCLDYRIQVTKLSFGALSGTTSTC